MANAYNISSGKTACPAATVAKVCCLAVSSATVEFCIPQFDISFDSVATGAGAIAVQVDLVRYTAASSGGTAPAVGAAGFTRLNPDISYTSGVTARINDTTEGTGVITLWGTLLVPNGLPLIVQYPLGREWRSKVSDFIALRITPQTGFTACNYLANLTVEE